MEECELRRLQEFLDNHRDKKHIKANTAAIEEECAPMAFYYLKWQPTSIGPFWSAHCYTCKTDTYLSEDIDF